MEQLDIFEILYSKFKLDKPVRMIELFAGYGSQSLAMKYLGVDFEHWKICEWAVPSIQAYKDAHFTDDNTDHSKELTKEEIINYLYEKGISMDYNEPMKLEQIKRLSENQLRNIYNNIKITNNLVNIQNTHGKDLEIVDKDKYEYILTYSFPCQDLSLAGLGKGMSRDSGTRSGMLWEVERILDECSDLGTLPTVLLMENVPQVVGQNSIKDFQSWREKLESLGYSNYDQCLNAKNYGVPQNRDRCFMVSILGDYSYTFPNKKPLDKKLKDLLENNVDEKYYLSDKMIDGMTKTNFECYKLENKLLDEEGISKTILARFEGAPQCIRVKEATKKGYKEAYDGDGVDISGRMESHRGTVQSGMSQTIKTIIDVGVVVKNDNLKTKMCNDLISNGKVKENDVIRHSYSTSRMNGEMKDIQQNNISPTLDTRCDCLGVVVKDEYIGTYNFSASDNFMHGRDRFKKDREVSATLLTTPKEAVVLKTNDPKCLGGIGEKKSNSGTQWYQQDRIYDDNIAMSVTTTANPYYKNDLRIRKLTPKECFRLMGVRDEDYENIAKNQSNSKLYHLAGDSIVVDVLMAIFKEMINCEN